jgi:hypothetical protein
MKKVTKTISRVTAPLWALIAPLTAYAALVDPRDRPSDIPDAVDIRVVIVRILNYVLSFVGLIAVGFLIWAGFLYLTSGGNEEQSGKAKKLILQVIIGIIIILLSWVIVNTIITQLSGNIASGTTTF